MEDDWRTPPERTLPLIRIHDVRGQQTNWGKAKELSRKWPRSHRKTQDLLSAASRYAQKKGWFSNERSRLLRVQSEIYALNKALQTETAPIMLATTTPAAFMIEFLSAFSDAFPNWQVEYSILNRLIPLCMRDWEATKTPPTVEAHILDPLHGDRTERWTVGEHIEAASVAAYGQGGKVYILIAYENGKPTTMTLKPKIWQDVKRQMDAVDPRK